MKLPFSTQHGRRIDVLEASVGHRERAIRDLEAKLRHTQALLDEATRQSFCDKKAIKLAEAVIEHKSAYIADQEGKIEDLGLRLENQRVFLETFAEFRGMVASAAEWIDAEIGPCSGS